MDVFVVRASGGEWEDHWTEVIGVRTTFESAQALAQADAEKRYKKEGVEGTVTLGFSLAGQNWWTDEETWDVEPNWKDFYDARSLSWAIESFELV